MNRRDFIRAALAIPAIAALPAPIQAAEELLEGITYISHAYTSWDLGAGEVTVVETWRKAGGKIWRCVASENEIISLTEERHCPWLKVPRWDIPIDTTAKP